MIKAMDHVVDRLQDAIRRESADTLERSMHFPIGWDPYFRDYMTLREVYHYATQHYDHHRRQLTLASAAAASELPRSYPRATVPRTRRDGQAPSVASTVGEQALGEGAGFRVGIADGLEVGHAVDDHEIGDA